MLSWFWGNQACAYYAFIKLPIMLLSNAPKISLLCSSYAQSCPVMLRVVLLCPRHAGTILQLTAQLEYFITSLNEAAAYVAVDLQCWFTVKIKNRVKNVHLCGDCSIRVYRTFLAQLRAKPAYCCIFRKQQGNLS